MAVLDVAVPLNSDGLVPSILSPCSTLLLWPVAAAAPGGPGGPAGPCSPQLATTILRSCRVVRRVAMHVAG